MSDDDIIEQAAQVIYDELSGKYGDFNMPTEAGEALHAAGLLHDHGRDMRVKAAAWNEGFTAALMQVQYGLDILVCQTEGERHE